MRALFRWCCFFFSLLLACCSRSICAMVEKWWWQKYWLSIGNIIGYARSCCKLLSWFVFFLRTRTLHLHFAWFEYTIFSERKISSAIPAARDYYLQITSYLLPNPISLRVDEVSSCFFLLLLLFVRWIYQNELFPRKPIIIWREWIRERKKTK